MPIFEPQTVIIIENTVGDISMFSFGLFIPVVSLVLLVSFCSFSFRVLSFSTCHQNQVLS